MNIAFKILHDENRNKLLFQPRRGKTTGQNTEEHKDNIGGPKNGPKYIISLSTSCLAKEFATLLTAWHLLKSLKLVLWCLAPQAMTQSPAYHAYL